MRIGILTHHYVKNFGAYMQANALISVIREKYSLVDVEVVDYRISKHERRNDIHFFGFKPTRGDTFLGLISKIRLFFTHKKYENAMPMSRRVKTADEINSLDYDLIIVGSDEVWNFNDIAYSPLKFGEKINCPIITYSASTGGSTVMDEHIPEAVRAGILKFEDISVRDEKSEELVRSFTDKEVKRTLDPVFLYDYKLVYRAKIENIAKKKPYILIYDCNLDSEQVSIIRDFAMKNGMNILGAGEYRNWYSTVETTNITPYEWAYLFKNAWGVITGTFHGTSFAIKYNRPFAAYLTEKNRINKVGSLLREFQLEKWMVTLNIKQSLIDTLLNKIDYSYVNKLIYDKRGKSLEYLFGNIDRFSGDK